MSGNAVTVQYTLLPKHNPEDEEELRRYDCSECEDDIFNLELHAQFQHDTQLFEVNDDETERPSEPPFHPCGVLGCTFAPHPEEPSRHSWSRSARA